MRLVVVGVAASFLGCQAFAAEPDAAEEHLKALALDCVRGHATQVDRVSESLTDAATFLVDDLCSPQIATYQRYVINLQLVAQMQASSNSLNDLEDMASASKPEQTKLRAAMDRQVAYWRAVKVDPATGDIEPPPSGLNGDAAVNNIAILANRGAGEPPAVFRGAAAEAVLAARTARLAKQP